MLLLLLLARFSQILCVWKNVYVLMSNSPHVPLVNCYSFQCTLQNGLNALLWAADRGHVDCVHALIATGTDVNTTDKVTSL